jgi:hypothetical protein
LDAGPIELAQGILAGAYLEDIAGNALKTSMASMSGSSIDW